MGMVANVVTAMETILGTDIEAMAAKHGVIQRKRIFSGQSLLQVIVLTLLKKPDANFEDMALTAAQLGIEVSATAVGKRFTQPLADFLRDVLDLAVKQLIAAEPIAVELLQRFTAVLIGDSSSIQLHDDLQNIFPGCGGSTEASCLAALKIQVRWNLKTGELPQILIEIGKASDSKSPISQQETLEGSLEIYDLGYFALERFRKLDDNGAFYISRLQHGTRVMNEEGVTLELHKHLAMYDTTELIDIPVVLGSEDRLPSRLIAVPCSEEVANRRRQKATEKARKHGRQPSADYLAVMCWSLFITNLPPQELTWKEAVVLYRMRWQIELLFKLWKSHNQVDRCRKNASPEECLAMLWAKLIAVLIQHWILLLAGWHETRRSLWKLANALRDWIVALIGAVNDHGQLVNTIQKIQSHLAHVVPIKSRKNKPSNFQLLDNPQLLDWASKV
jgi:hypothetical protein